MIIKSKEKLKLLINENIKKHPLTEKYFNSVVLSLLATETLTNLLEINLIRYLATDSVVMANFEKYLNEKDFTNIQNPISRLKNNFGEYYAVIAELETAKRLKKEGMTNIKFLPTGNNPDIEFEDKGIKRYAEVKNFMEINPEITIIDNIIRAKALRSKSFQKTFMIDCSYDLTKYGSVDALHKDIRKSAKTLVKKLEAKLKLGDLEDEMFILEPLTLKISAKKGTREIMLAFSSGNPFIFSSASESFLELSSVYLRFLSTFRKGYIQLLKKREYDKALVKTDRIYQYLNIGRGSHFIPKEAKKIFTKLAKVVGISELVNLKIQL